MSSLGSLVVSLAMDTAKFIGDIGKAGQQMGRLAADAAKMGAAIGANIAIGMRAVSSMVQETVRAQVELSNLAVVAGTSEAELSRLAAGARLAGVQQDKLADILKDTQDKLGDFLQTGAGPLADFFEKIAPQVGVTAEQFARLSGPEALKLYVSSLERANLTQAEMVFYMEAIASDSTLLLPLLRNNSKGFDDMGAAAERFGAVAAPEVVAQSKEMHENFVLLDLAKQGLANRITAELLPVMNELTTGMLRASTAGERLADVARVAAAGVKLITTTAVIGAGAIANLGTLIGGLAASAAALASGEFRMSARIMSEAVSDATRRRDEIWSTVASIWSASGPAGAASQRAQHDWPGRIVEPLVRARQKVKTTGKEIVTEAQRIAKQIDEQLAAMQLKVDTQGASERVRGLIELTRKGASPEQIERYLQLARAVEAYEASVAAATKAGREEAEQAQEMRQLYEDTRTPIEILTLELARLEELRAKGLDMDVYARAVFAAQEKFEAATKSAEKTLDNVSVFVERARQNIQDAIGDGLVEIMNGNFKNIGDAFVKMLQRMVAEALAAKLTEALFGPAKPGGTGGGGIFGNVLSSIGSFLFGGKAYGGPVSAGRAVRVGEHGPEVFMPATAGSIIPERQLAGPPRSIVVNVQAVPGMSRQTALQQGQLIGEGVQRALTRNG